MLPYQPMLKVVSLDNRVLPWHGHVSIIVERVCWQKGSIVKLVHAKI